MRSSQSNASWVHPQEFWASRMVEGPGTSNAAPRNASESKEEPKAPQGEDMAEQKAKLFDRFAEASAGFVSRAPFFVACVLLVLLWAPSFWLFPNVDTWQLVINTATTIVTFLMVALLQNSQHRAEQAIHQKLDALADGLADFMEHLGGDQPSFAKDIDDLRRSVGIEKEMVDKHAPGTRG